MSENKRVNDADKEKEPPKKRLSQIFAKVVGYGITLN